VSDDVYSLRLLRRVREVPREKWDALVGDESSPFVEWTWLDALEETGCVGEGTGWLPAHLSMWRERGSGGTGEADLVGVAPSYIKSNSEGEFVFDWGWADAAYRMGIEYYPKIVVSVPFTPITGDRLLVASDEDRGRLTHLLAGAAKQWCSRLGASGVHVLFPREDEAAAWERSGYLRRDGYQFHWFREGASTYDEYLSRFSSKQRNQIKREQRGVAERGIVVDAVPSGGHTRDLARTMHAFYRSTIERHGVWGRMYLSEPFFEALVECFRDRLAWIVARDERGHAVAGAFNVVKGSRLYGRYWGSRVEVPFLHFAVCYYAGIRYCIERRIDVFEPGAGGEHKRPRGFVPTLTRSAHWIADNRLRGLLGPWLQRERAKVQRVIRTGDEGDLTES
jgi:uncharacterized protein